MVRRKELSHCLAILLILSACSGSGDNQFPYTSWTGSGSNGSAAPPVGPGPAGNITYTISPAAGSAFRTLSNIDITYGQAVVGGNVAGNYLLSGAGLGTLVVMGANQISGNTYRIVFWGTPGTGAVSLTVAGLKNSGGALFSSQTINYTADGTAPTATPSPAENTYIPQYGWSSVDFTFSESVTGANLLANYTLGGTAVGGLTKVSVTNPSASVYRLNLAGSTAFGTGTVTVTLANITDMLGNPLTAATTYTFNNDPPFASTYNPTSSNDVPQAIAIDANGVYVAGSNYNSGYKEMRLSKWDRVTGATVSVFGTSGYISGNPTSYDDEYMAIKIDAGNLYTVAHTNYNSGSNGNWIIEKRDTGTGAFISGFGSGGSITEANGFSPSVAALEIQGANLFVAGMVSGLWRIEKRDKTTGNFVSAFGSGGVITSSTGGNVYSMTSDSQYLYIAGGYSTCCATQGRIEKRDINTGALVAVFGSSGAINDSSVNGFRRIYADATDLYLISQTGWRVQKRSKSSGNLNGSFGSGLGYISTNFTGNELAYDMALDSTGFYVVGQDYISSNYQQRIEKRDLSTGALVTTYGTSGVALSNPSSGTDYIAAVAVDTNYLYLFGADANGGGEWRVDKSRNR
jgi:hypothetical protein